MEARWWRAGQRLRSGRDSNGDSALGVGKREKEDEGERMKGVE
jgi:hypothetical protein